MARTCCPQYTIRLDAKAFKPGKKHRQAMNRFNRFLSTGCQPGDGKPLEANNASGSGTIKGRGNAKIQDNWTDVLREYEMGFGIEGQHCFQV